ncbi:MAG: hypothetical protein ABEI98_09585 [Halorhabdus sp.]
MREIVGDVTDNTPVVRLRCPECNATIDTEYSVLYGQKMHCEECSELLLVTFNVETGPE